METPTKEQVLELRKACEEFYAKYHLLKEQFEEAEKEYFSRLERFKTADYQLALVDGRLKRLPPSIERKEKKQPELTMAQLTEIAEKLGIKVTINEDQELEIDKEEFKEDKTLCV